MDLNLKVDLCLDKFELFTAIKLIDIIFKELAVSQN